MSRTHNLEVTYLLYGVNGFTGELTAVMVKRNGDDLILAVRNEEEIQKLATRLDLPYQVFDLKSHSTIVDNLSGIDLVLHCAGPYKFTAEPMVDACLAAGVHYLDITGEYSVFEYIINQQERASDVGIVMIPGIDFDIVPTENLIALLHERLPEATSVKIAIYGLGRPSKG